MYINDLSVLLTTCGRGCLVGDTLINHLMYVNDLLIFSPYTAVLIMGMINGIEVKKGERS